MDVLYVAIFAQIICELYQLAKIDQRIAGIEGQFFFCNLDFDFLCGF